MNPPNSRYFRVRLTRPQIERAIQALGQHDKNDDIIEALRAARAQCRWWWQPGLLVPPGTTLRKHERCLLDENHEGGHTFPDEGSPEDYVVHDSDADKVG